VDSGISGAAAVQVATAAASTTAAVHDAAAAADDDVPVAAAAKAAVPDECRRGGVLSSSLLLDAVRESEDYPDGRAAFYRCLRSADASADALFAPDEPASAAEEKMPAGVRQIPSSV
jgi:phage tail sheath gpL-like